MVKLLIDYRERKIIEKLDKLNCKVEIQNLEVGDIVVLKNNCRLQCTNNILDFNGTAIIIERKSIQDFVNSVRSNHIWEQLFKLMNIEQMRGYIIEHKLLVIQKPFQEYFDQIPVWNLKKHNNYRFWKYMLNTLVDIILVYQIPVIFLYNDEQFYELLKILIDRDLRCWNPWVFEAKRYATRKRQDLPVKDKKLYLLCSLPSVGPVLGKRLLNRFDSIAKITTASVKKLQKVKGVGKKRAETIYKIFHE